MAPAASRVGTIDPMGKSRVYTDETLKTVPAGSSEAAFVFKRGELERIRDRRTELGLDKHDEALRVMLASRKAAVPSVERRIAALKAELEELTAGVAALEKSETKPASKSTAKAEDKSETKADSKAETKADSN